METDKIQSIIPAEPAEQVIEITTATLADLAGKLADSVAKPLLDRIQIEVEKGIGLAAIRDSQTYLDASQQRKTLKGLINEKGDPTASDRLQVILNLVIADAKGQKLGIATKTTVGMVSLDDLFGPLADMYHKLHRATTQGRNNAESAIEAVRKMLETAVLDWEAAIEKRRREEEDKQRKLNEQKARIDRADHWIKLLAAQGVTPGGVFDILGHDVATITDQEVEKLETLLREKLIQEETRKQEAELQDAIKTAKSMGLSQSIIDELSQETPGVVEAPAPPPPPVFVPVRSAIAQAFVPAVKGQGSTIHYKLIIEDPMKIPAEYLLPPAKKLYDPQEYPRLRAKANLEGTRMSVPGVRVEEEKKLTQR